MKIFNLKNHFFNNTIEKSYLLISLIREAGYKYFAIVLIIRLLNTILDFSTIGFSINYFFSSENKLPFIQNISLDQAIICLLILIIFKAVTKAYADVIREKIRMEFTDKLRRDFLKKVLFSSNSSTKDIAKKEFIGLLFGNISSSVQSLDQILRFFSSNISLLIYLIGLISLEKRILVPIFLAVIATLIAGFIKRSKGWELGTIQRKLNSSLLTIIGDGMNGLKSIKSNGAQKWLLNKFSNDTYIYRKIYQEQLIRKSYFDGLKDVFLVLIMGIWLIKFSNLSNSGVILSTLLFSFKVSQYSSRIIASFRLIFYSLPGYKNLKEISKKIEKDFYLPKLKATKNVIQNKVNSFKWETKQKLKVKKLYIQNNQIVVVKGKSGIGKTTLLDNIIGLDNPRKSKWQIEIDGYYKKISGESSNNEIFNFVSYCPQENMIFEGSLKENLFLSSTKRNNQKDNLLIKYFFDELDLLHLLSRFKNLNKNVNLSSKPFSGGELQRLCIIRTLLKNKPIEVYDEPTHYLDKSTGERVLDFLIKRNRNKILIISTHEEYIVSKADIVLNLDQ